MVTSQNPFAARSECAQIDSFIASEPQIERIAVVRPRSELHVTVLVIEGEPCRVHLARRLEDAFVTRLNVTIDYKSIRGQSGNGAITGRDPRTSSVVTDDHVRMQSRIDAFVGRIVQQNIRFPDAIAGDAQCLDVAVLRRIPLHVHVLPVLFVEVGKWCVSRMWINFL
jgi:hypothetical protein